MPERPPIPENAYSDDSIKAKERRDLHRKGIEDGIDAEELARRNQLDDENPHASAKRAITSEEDAWLRRYQDSQATMKLDMTKEEQQQYETDRLVYADLLKRKGEYGVAGPVETEPVAVEKTVEKPDVGKDIAA